MPSDPPSTFNGAQIQLLEQALIHARQALTEHEDGCAAVEDFTSEIGLIDEALTLLGYDPPPTGGPLRRVK